MLEESAASAVPSSIWESMNSWFTPTVLFILLNVVIGTIAFTSTLANQKSHHNNNNQQGVNDPKIERAPSVLQRLKSVNFYAHYRSHQEQENPSVQNKLDPDSETLFGLETTQSSYFYQTPNQENFEENLDTTVRSQTHYVFEENRVENSLEKQTHLDFEGRESSFDEENELQSMDEVFSKLTGGHFSRTKSDTEPYSGAIPARIPARMRKSASLKSAFGHFETEEKVEARRPATVREKGNAKVTDGDEEVDAKADDFINRFKQQLKLQRLDSIIRYKDVIARTAGR